MALIGGLMGGALGGGGGLGFLQLGAGLLLKWLFPQKIKGPRADNLKVQTSRYGDPIARVHGTARVAGACVWLHEDQITETKETSRQGKALGPEITEFRYHFTGAIKVAWNGPFEAIPRIWADDKLIYDQSAESLSQIIDGEKDGGELGVVGGAKVTIYLGTDTQDPDPDWQADKGLDATPALRGYAYVVIKDLSLEEFGIRIPNFEVELVKSAALQWLDDPLASDFGKDRFVDANAGLIAGFRPTIGAVLGRGTIWRAPTMSTTMDFQADAGFWAVDIDDQGYVFVPRYQGGIVRVYDGYAGIQLPTITGLTPTVPGIGGLTASISIDGITHLFVWAAQQLHLITGSGGVYAIAWSVDTNLTADELVGPAVTLSVSDQRLYAARNSGSGKSVAIIDWSAISPADTVVAPVTVTLTEPTDGIYICHYDPESDSVVVIDQDGNILVYDPEMTTLLRQTKISPTVAWPLPNTRASKRLKSGPDTIALVANRGAGEVVLEYRLSTLEKLIDQDVSAIGLLNGGNGIFPFFVVEQQYRVIVVEGANYAWFLPRQQKGKVTLASVIAAECALVDLDNDVSDITGDVYGVGIREGASPRGAIEDLQQVKFFDFAHVDGTTKFFMRDATVDATVALTEMGHAVPGSEQPWEAEEDYPDPHDLPLHVALKYVAADADYRSGTQYSSPPDSFDDNRSTFSIETSLVMDDDEAAQSADILWTEILETASRFKTRLGPKYLRLHPGDVVSLPLDADRSVTAVLDRQAGEHILECELRARDFDYLSSATGAVTPSNPNSLLGQATMAIFLPMDGHLLRAADDDDSFYMGAYPRDGTLSSSAIYRSTDGGTTWSLWSGLSAGLVIGLARAALPDRPHPQAWDRASSFTVGMISGTFPGSVTEAAMLSDQTINVFAVESVDDEWEYIRAATMVDNGDGTWTLSDLLRGQHGTEFAMAGHSVGDRVLHIDSATLARSPDADRTLARKYIAVTSSGSFSEAFAVTFTNTGRGLRPWSPIGLDGQRTAADGDWGIKWNRRDRVPQSGSAIMASGLVMNEDAESYDVRLYDGGGAVVETYTVSTEAFTYTAAQQVTDFGSEQASIIVGVVQNSAVYGAGIEERVTL